MSGNVNCSANSGTWRAVLSLFSLSHLSLSLFVYRQQQQQLDALGVHETALQNELLSVITTAVSRLRRVLDSTSTWDIDAAIG